MVLVNNLLAETFTLRNSLVYDALSILYFVDDMGELFGTVIESIGCGPNQITII